jgi:hypothetical protein
MESGIEYRDSFSEAKIIFVEFPLKRLLEPIPLWIKMLFVEKIFMHVELDRMAE